MTREHIRAPPLHTRDGHDSATHVSVANPSGADHAAIGNQTLQRLFSSRTLRAKLEVGGTDDPEEREADRIATAAVDGSDQCSCTSGDPDLCPACNPQAPNATLRRKPDGSGRGNGGDAPGNVVLGTGRGLSAADRAFFEPRFGTSLERVRVHTDSPAEVAAAQLGARAFALGDSIAFGRGEYDTHTTDGRHLLAHELVHVVQAPEQDRPRVRRQTVEPPVLRTGDHVRPIGEYESEGVSLSGGETLKVVADPEGGQVQVQLPAPYVHAYKTFTIPVARVTKVERPAAAVLTGTFDERVAAFKQLVKTTAIHRLKANQRNLALWGLHVEQQLPERDLGAVGLLQGGGSRPYLEAQDISDPALRELRAHQTVGRYRLCTGCHIEKDLYATRGERERESLNPEEWLTPNERRQGVTPGPGLLLPPAGASHDMAMLEEWLRAGAGQGAPSGPSPTSPMRFPAAGEPAAGYTPQPGTLEARLHEVLPAPDDVYSAMERVRPILQELGPDKYKVLPASILAELETGSVESVRDQIIAAIHQRHADYEEFIGKIRAGEVDYDHFGPIIQDLLPLVDSDVRNAIQEEMDEQARWELVKAIGIGLLTIFVLILVIAPPTSAIGVFAGGALGSTLLGTAEVGLALYGAATAPEMIRTGQLDALGTGADDVISPEQQEAAGGLILGGFLNIVLAPLGVASGAARLESAAAQFARAGSRSTSALAIADTASLQATAQPALRPGDTFVAGPFVGTVSRDGSIVAHVLERPELLIIVRGNTATLYQSMGPAGMRVLKTVPLQGAGGVSSSGGTIPLLTSGEELSGAAGLVPAPAAPVGPAPLSPHPPSLVPGPAEPGVLPPARPPLLLTSGNPTTMTWEQTSALQNPALWRQREIYLQEMYGSQGQQHFGVPGTGGRYVDVPVQVNPNQLLAGEAKSYNRLISVRGQQVQNEVRLSSRIRRQIARDVWLRDNIPGFDPRWIFTDAPPSAELSQALREANIVSVIHH